MNRKSEEIKEEQISKAMLSIENRVRHAYNQGFEQGLKVSKQEPKTGHWIKHEQNGIGHIECSECLAWFLEPHLLRNSYCPNCGAKMESEGEGMTREQALELLADARYADDLQGNNDLQTAHNMAIEALKQEPCEDCISRKDVENIVNKYIDGSFQWGAMLVEIKRLPSVKIAERVRRWIELKDGYDDEYYECTICGTPLDTIVGTPDDNGFNFCPFCGAKMESEE